MTARIVIIGSGGAAREIAWLIEDINEAAGADVYEMLGYVVTDPTRLTERDSPVLGGYDWLEAHRSDFDVLALGIGSPAARLKVASELNEYEFPTLIHPSVIHSRRNKFGRGVIVSAGSIVTVNVTLDDFVLVNLTCTLGHESSVGRGTAINPGVNVSGGVRIGAGCLIGTGSQIRQYLSIGDGATVGAGAVVVKDVPPGVTVVGVPAAPVARKPHAMAEAS